MIAAMKVLILIAALLFLFPSPVLCVRAEEAASPAAEVYAVAARNDVWLYAEENEESGLFLLPYTYYVRVEERGEEFSSVVYGTDEAPTAPSAATARRRCSPSSTLSPNAPS